MTTAEGTPTTAEDTLLDELTTLIDELNDFDMTAAEAAAKADVSPVTVKRALNSGQLHGLKNEVGQWLTNEVEIEKWKKLRQQLKHARSVTPEEIVGMVAKLKALESDNDKLTTQAALLKDDLKTKNEAIKAKDAFIFEQAEALQKKEKQLEATRGELLETASENASLHEKVTDAESLEEQATRGFHIMKGRMEEAEKKVAEMKKRLTNALTEAETLRISCDDAKKALADAVKPKGFWANLVAIFGK